MTKKTHFAFASALALVLMLLSLPALADWEAKEIGGGEYESHPTVQKWYKKMMNNSGALRRSINQQYVNDTDQTIVVVVHTHDTGGGSNEAVSVSAQPDPSKTMCSNPTQTSTQCIMVWTAYTCGGNCDDWSDYILVPPGHSYIAWGWGGPAFNDWKE